MGSNSKSFTAQLQQYHNMTLNHTINTIAIKFYIELFLLNPFNRQVPDIPGAAGILRTPAAGYIRRYMPRLYWYLATGIFCLWRSLYN